MRATRYILQQKADLLARQQQENMRGGQPAVRCPQSTGSAEEVIAVTRGAVRQDDPEAPEEGALPLDDVDSGHVWSPVSAGPFAGAWLAAKRLRHTWRLLLPIGLGILIAVMLLGAVPLYSIQVTNTLLRQELTLTAQPSDAAAGQPQRTASAINVDAVAAVGPIARSDADAIARNTAELARATIAPFMQAATDYAETADTLIIATVNGEDFARRNPAVSEGLAQPLAYDYTQAAPHMRLPEGQLPQDESPTDLPQVLATEQSNLHPSDVVTLVDRMTGQQQVQVRVVGVWRPVNPQDPFWNDRSFDSLVDYGRDSGPPPVFPLLFTRTGFFAGLHAVFAMTGVTLHHVFYPAPDRFTAESAPMALNALLAFRTHFDVIVFRAHVVTSLDSILRDVQRQLGLLAQPLYIVVLQVAGLILFFVAAMAALLLDLEGGELATLKSRGASITQVVCSLLLQSLPIAAVAAAAGLLLAPFLALTVLRIFLPGAAVSATPAALLRPTTLAATLPPAGAAVVLCLATLVASAWLATRRDVLAFRREQGRATQLPLWRRYYLDVLLVVLCAAGYLELVPFGGLGAREQLNGQGAGPDPLLLVTPSLILLAGALITLRFLPLGAGLGAWLAARGRGAPMLLAFAQLARATRQFTRLALVLTLTVGLAVFALIFNASIDSNATDRAAYVAGGDLRFEYTNSTKVGYYAYTRLNDQFARLPGVRAVTSIYRTVGYAPQEEGGTGAAILGIEPDTLGSVANWRADFAGQPLDSLLRQLSAHHLAGGAPGAADTPIWALVSTGLAQALHLQLGQPFTLNPQENLSAALHFTAGAFLDNFPTAADTPGAFVIVDQDDLVGGLRDPALVNVSVGSPNDYWLRTTGRPGDDAARAAALKNPLIAEQIGTPGLIIDRRSVAAALRSGPLVSGLRGLLLGGAVVAALLAIFTSVLQALTTVRQRSLQFAVLRTLGTARSQLVRLLLTEQLVIYSIGLLAGGALGLLVSTAALPFLEFTSSTAGAGVSSAALPYTLVLDPHALMLFIGVLLAGFALALRASVVAAARLGLGGAMRSGDD